MLIQLRSIHREAGVQPGHGVAKQGCLGRGVRVEIVSRALGLLWSGSESAAFTVLS